MLPNPNDEARPKVVFLHHSIRRLWRAWWVRDNSKLSADEAASTLFRFFRSQHVFDLRLIVRLTWICLWTHLTLVLAFALARPAFHLCTAFHKHTVWKTYDGFTAMASHIFWILGSNGLPAFGTYFAPAIAIYSGILAWAYLSAAKRLGVVDLFACEIGTLCRVGTIFDVAPLYVDKFGEPKEKSQSAEQHAITETRKESSTPQPGAKTFVSEEDYFPVFKDNSSDLQMLEALVVINITEFYTYMKASRDLLRALPLAEEHDRLISLVNLIYVLFLGFESGRKSIEKLVEFEPTKAEDTVVILLTELFCYKFLTKHFETDPENVRNKRLALRKEVYRNEVPRLCRKINSWHGDNDHDWQPARETTDELGRRYEDALGETMDAAIKRIEEDEKRLRSRRPRLRFPAFSPRF